MNGKEDKLETVIVGLGVTVTTQGGSTNIKTTTELNRLSLAQLRTLCAKLELHSRFNAEFNGSGLK